MAMDVGLTFLTPASPMGNKTLPSEKEFAYAAQKFRSFPKMNISLTFPKVAVLSSDIDYANNLLCRLVALGYPAQGITTNFANASTLIHESGAALLIIDHPIGGQPRATDKLAEFAMSSLPQIRIPVLHLFNSDVLNVADAAAVARPVSYLLKPFSDLDLHATLQISIERQSVAAKLEANVKEGEERLRKELQAFVSKVVHDLHAPLRHMDGFAQLALERSRETADDNEKYLTRIVTASAKMSGLIDALRGWSQVGLAELAPRQIDLNALVNSVMQECMAGVAGRQVEWRIGKLPTVRGDSGLLREAFLNLISNALKFTRRSDAVVIEVCARLTDNDEVEVCVRDNGVGFDARYGDKLFGVFQRLHHERDFEGVGIGLATVRKIIERHGGETWATGELGKGADFYLTLRPAAPSSQQQVNAAA